MMVDSKPTVAVIIPTYNRADRVSAAINSLLVQTRPPKQIIVIDDGSTDDTRAVLADYDDKITAIHQENRGRSAARNAGLQQVSTDYVAFLDSDDTLPPESIACRAQILDDRPEVDVVYGDAWVEVEGSRERILYSQYRLVVNPNGLVFGAIAAENFAPLHCFLFRATCLQHMDGFDVTLDTLEDHDFWLRMSAFAYFYYLDTPVATYVIHGGMTTLTMPDKMRLGRYIVQQRAVAMPEFAALTPPQQSRVFSSLGSTCLALGKPGEARGWFHKAIDAAPAIQPLFLYVVTFFGVRLTHALLSFRRRLRKILKPNTRLFYE
jgi:glycosyltransferase involved in cell wall biosynthesis